MPISLYQFRFPLPTLVFCLSTVAGIAHAGEEDAKLWTLGAFGTVGVVHSGEKQADYQANPLNPGEAGATHDWSYHVDSRLGAQLSLNAGNGWSAVLQVVAERGLKNSYTPVVEWANVKYQVTPDLSLRLGRTALPLFLTADYRKASYALPWARPPVELYSALPISNSDGIDASYRWNVAGVKNVTQLIYGNTRLHLWDDRTAEAHQLAGVSNTSSSGAWTVRATALKGELDMKLAEDLFNGIRQFGPQGEVLARRYETDRKRATVVSAGVNYDPGNWFVMAEVGRVNARSFLGDKSAGYISGGYRFAALTPYVGYSKVVANTPTHVDGLSTDGLPPVYAQTAQMLNGELNGLLSTIAEQDTATAGLRWDFASNFALKLQYDRVRPRAGTSGTLVNIQPGFRSGRAFGVVSAVVDFVF